MKKIIVLLGIGVVSFSVQASYLFWQIDSEDLAGKVTPYATKIETPWDKATLYAVDSEGTKYSLKEWVVENANEDETNPYDGFTAGKSINLGDYYSAGYSYYVEMVNSEAPEKGVIGYTQQTYAQLAGFVTDQEFTPETIPAAQIWHGGSYNAPEPTSAMLMMLGVAALGLRRKQRKQA